MRLYRIAWDMLKLRCLHSGVVVIAVMVMVLTCAYADVVICNVVSQDTSVRGKRRHKYKWCENENLRIFNSSHELRIDI